RSGPPAGPGGRMVNSSNPSSDSWLASSTVVTTLYSNGISAPKHRASSGQLAKNSHARRGTDDRRPGHAEEQSMLDDTRDRMERHAECRVDRAKAGVEHQVAVVGREWAAERHPELWPPTKGLDRAAGRLPQKGQHLDRDRATPQSADQLGLIRDQHESAAGVSDDLLPQQCPAASLDTVEGRVDLVRPVDRQVE